MDQNAIYRDIAGRCGGDIYIGVVGPVRTGKSTFIKRFTETLVIPNITDKYGNKAGKVYGPLSKLISVEEKYITAIETALGPNLQHIVVEDESVAKAAMFALKKAEAGRATFFPLTSMKAVAPSKELTDAAGFAGYVGRADELCQCDSKFGNVISSLLGMEYCLVFFSPMVHPMCPFCRSHAALRLLICKMHLTCSSERIGG